MGCSTLLGKSVQSNTILRAQVQGKCREGCFFRVQCTDLYIWAQRGSLVFALARKEYCYVPVQQLSAVLPLGADERWFCDQLEKQSCHILRCLLRLNTCSHSRIKTRNMSNLLFSWGFCCKWLVAFREHLASYWFTRFHVLLSAANTFKLPRVVFSSFLHWD